MAEASITVSLRDVASVELLLIMLRLLHDQMRVEANPRADDLGAILDRWERPISDGGENDGEDG